MNTQEKQAWFSLCVLAAAVTGYASLYAISKSHLAASSAFSLMALLAAQGLIDRGKRKEGVVLADERDTQINSLSLVAAYSIFWVAFVAATVAPFFLMGEDAIMRIRTADLATIVWPAMCLVIFVRSSAVIFLYRRHQSG
jgi:hypothetical protein